ncbi:MAG: YIP1 family protein [Myxococcota bacterium]
MKGFLGRIGGVILAPRRTLYAILSEGGGNFGELLFLMLLVTITVSPNQAGEAFLIMRRWPLDGLMQLFSLVATRMAGQVIAAVVAAALLLGIAKLRQGTPSFGFDRALDACLYALIPFLLLSSLGAALSELGLEAWFMPHRVTQGPPLILAARVLAGYGWSIVLFAMLAIRVAKEGPHERSA